MVDHKQIPHPFIAIIPLVTLIAMLAVVVFLFGGDALTGATQIALLLATSVCICISIWKYHIPWAHFEEQIKEKIGNIAVSLIILLLIGMLSGSWMISGIVPTIIYYGIQIMSPQFFLVCTCVICSLISLLSGSSWTTIATIGVALIGIGDALGVSAAWVAGAIISGAYFGDKMSPLSDTTILASSSTGVDIFSHIHYMFFTTIPTMTITLSIFLVAGFTFNSTDALQVGQYTTGLSNTFHLSLWTLIVPILTGVMIAKKLPSLVTLFISSLMAGVFAIILQPDLLKTIAGVGTNLSSAMAVIKGITITFFGSTAIDTGNASLNELVSTRGMAGMLNTIWLIVCSMCFGSAMVSSRMLESITKVIVRFVHSRLSLVSSTACTGIFLNLITADQYISIILTADLYGDVYKREGYESRLLSRTTEDAATVTSVLIPWNSCGMTQSTVLGVPTFMYLPYCFFNYLSPFMTVLVAAIGWKIRKRVPNPEREKEV